MSMKLGNSGERIRAVALAMAIAATGSVDAAAQSKEHPPPHGPILERYRSALESGNEQTVLAALSKIRANQELGARVLVDELLGRGGNVTIIVAAIQTAATLGQEASSSPLLPYVRHRQTHVRHAAVQALAKTGGAPAIRSLRAALRSRDGALRGLAASGLGKIGNASVVPDLFRALDLMVLESAPSIAKLCSSESCPRLIPQLAKLPFPILLDTFDSMVLRPGGQLTDGVKILAITNLAALRTKKVHHHLLKLQRTWPKGLSPQAKKALDAAVITTTGAVQ